jgi:periplasmic protein TonB
MRVLIVDSDSEMLESIARRLRDGFSIDIVTSKADALDLLRQNDWNVIVACERLNDGSGLDLLSQTAKRWPQTLRLFAAPADRLALLRGRLGPFKLFQTLNYPIDGGELGAILMLAQAAEAADADTANVQHIVLGEDSANHSESPAAILAQAALSAPPSLAVARGAAARPLPFTVPTGTPGPTRAPAPTGAPVPTRAPAPTPAPRPPAPQRKPLTREALARVPPAALVAPSPKPVSPQIAPRAAPEKATAPAYRLAPVRSQVLPALALLRSRLHSAPSGLQSRRMPLLIAAAAAGILVLGGLAVWVGSLVEDPSPVAAETDRRDVEVESVIKDLETAITADDTRRARRALQRLRKLAPKHDRLAFFQSVVKQREAAARSAAARTAAIAELDRWELAAQPKIPPKAAAPTPPVHSTEASATVRESLPAATAVEPSASTFSGRTLEASARGKSAVPESTAQEGLASSSVAPPVVREAKLVKRTAPDYPPGAAANGTEGSVEIGFTISASGRVTDTVVLSETAPGIFDAAALSAVRHWRYEPRLEDGFPVDWRTQVRIDFRLAE